MFSGNYLFDIKVLDNGEVFLWQMEKLWKDSDMKEKMVLQIYLPAQQMEPLKLKLPLIDVEFLIIVNAKYFDVESKYVENWGRFISFVMDMRELPFITITILISCWNLYVQVTDLQNMVFVF